MWPFFQVWDVLAAVEILSFQRVETSSYRPMLSPAETLAVIQGFLRCKGERARRDPDTLQVEGSIGTKLCFLAGKQENIRISRFWRRSLCSLRLALPRGLTAAPMRLARVPTRDWGAPAGLPLGRVRGWRGGSRSGSSPPAGPARSSARTPLACTRASCRAGRAPRSGG